MQAARIEGELAAEAARLAAARVAVEAGANPGVGAGVPGGGRGERRSATLTARIPAWLEAEVGPDMRELGIGKMKWGGSQGVATVALGMWAALPREERMEMALGALMMTRLPESIGRARLGTLWPVRVLVAMSRLGEEVRVKRVLELEGEGRQR